MSHFVFHWRKKEGVNHDRFLAEIFPKFVCGVLNHSVDDSKVSDFLQ